MQQLRKWIPSEEVLDLHELCSNPNAIGLIEQKWSQIRTDVDCLAKLVKNPGAAHLMETHWEEIWRVLDQLEDEDELKIFPPNATHSPRGGCSNRRFCKDINFSLLDFCENPSMIYLVEKHWNHLSEKLNGTIYWQHLCNNPNAVSLLLNHWDFIVFRNYLLWEDLALNPSADAVHLIDQHWNSIPNLRNIVCGLCANPNPAAIALLEKHWDELEAKDWIVWRNLCGNPNAISLLDKHLPQRAVFLDSESWGGILANSNAAHLVKRYWYIIKHGMDEYDWGYLCGNPNAISLLEIQWEEEKWIQHKVNWVQLCANPNAVSFLEKHWGAIQNHVDWTALCCNPNPNAWRLLLEKNWATLCEHFDWNRMFKIVNTYWLRSDSKIPLPVAFLDKYGEQLMQHPKIKKQEIHWSSVSANPLLFVEI